MNIRTFKRRALQGLAALAGLAALGTSAQAQSYPNRPVKIVVPFAAGGPADNYARFVAQRLGEELKQSFVIDNKPGAGSIIGTDLVAKSPADGYTLLMMSNTHTVNESLIPSKPFALMKDFVGIAPINYSSLLLVVHPSVPAKNVAELIALAKARPGKLNHGSSGAGTSRTATLPGPGANSYMVTTGPVRTAVILPVSTATNTLVASGSA